MNFIWVGIEAGKPHPSFRGDIITGAYKAFSEYEVKEGNFHSESDHRIALLQTEFDVANKKRTAIILQREDEKTTE